MMPVEAYDSAMRRPTVPAHAGGVTIGAPAPVVIQSMATAPTLDTEAAAAQTASIAAAGAELVRLTAQGVNHASNLAAIKRRAAELGCTVPLVADIHFNPAAAFEAALHVEKVRINPGNFFDPGRTFRKMEFTDEEYAAELEGIRARFLPFLALCREHGTAIRIGVNHGSLSDRIMSRYGDGAEGMVESAMEFLRICRDDKFTDAVVSIKASTVAIMTDTVRLLVERMDAEDMHYPLHLGVTEAGNALEGRVKSAAGIGSLLVDGIGDTIRVSLSERPENEIPVARMLVDYAAEAAREVFAAGVQERRRRPKKTSAPATSASGTTLYIKEKAKIASARKALAEMEEEPSLIVLDYTDIADRELLTVAAAVDFGTVLLDGYDGEIEVRSPLLDAEEGAELCRTILQAVGRRRFKAEIVACPGCGRTLYSLPEVLEVIKERFSHLKHLKIAVMGCIVNGPGEMADADYGYVGGGRGLVNLYRGKECLAKGIPQAEAPAELERLIRADGMWTEKGEER